MIDLGIPTPHDAQKILDERHNPVFVERLVNDIFTHLILEPTPDAPEIAPNLSLSPVPSYIVFGGGIQTKLARPWARACQNLLLYCLSKYLSCNACNTPSPNRNYLRYTETRHVSGYTVSMTLITKNHSKSQLCVMHWTKRQELCNAGNSGNSLITHLM